MSKRCTRFLFVLAFLALLFAGGAFFHVSGKRTSSGGTVVIGGENVFVTMANTPALREQGLSGRTGLGPQEGMLFVFDTDGIYSFWMKDMLFPIDIVWIASDGRIVHIEKSLSPATYPRSFTSTSPARYALELPAGYMDAHHMAVSGYIEQLPPILPK